jgi:hypothetical protein
LGRAGPAIARIAREHEAVDDERVLAGREQFGKPDLAAPVRDLLEDVIVGDGTTEWQLASLFGDTLNRAAKLELGFEQAVALTPVLVGLAWKADFRIGRQRARVYGWTAARGMCMRGCPCAG